LDKCPQIRDIAQILVTTHKKHQRAKELKKQIKIHNIGVITSEHTPH